MTKKNWFHLQKWKRNEELYLFHLQVIYYRSFLMPWCMGDGGLNLSEIYEKWESYNNKVAQTEPLKIRL